MTAQRFFLDLVCAAWPVHPDDAFAGSQEDMGDFTFKLADTGDKIRQQLANKRNGHWTPDCKQQMV
ncbi:hypothetical protein N0V91_005190 [Didymella pomorum]|uniref:Uncharacterized protein n=1 Tax=Didymella pomorum TaxID=749634 RepID=A0A9W9D7K3_9PLEO|nr:hypothetical protein N0V91_005190 [Didymella pomorum]